MSDGMASDEINGVPPQTRAQAAEDNSLAVSRRVR